MSFRPATLTDEPLLLKWRQADELDAYAAGWWHGTPTTPAKHARWFADRLDHITILIWEEKGEPLGMLRIDSNGELAFHAERDAAVRLLSAAKRFAKAYEGRLKLTLDPGDPRIAAAEAAGFTELPVRFFRWRP